jgi:hypothetical protein
MIAYQAQQAFDVYLARRLGRLLVALFDDHQPGQVGVNADLHQRPAVLTGLPRTVQQGCDLFGYRLHAVCQTLVRAPRSHVI